jgi:hypothetical protein
VKLTQDRDFRLMWAERIDLGFALPGPRNLGSLGNSYDSEKLPMLLKSLVDETGIEPATSSLRTMEINS